MGHTVGGWSHTTTCTVNHLGKRSECRAALVVRVVVGAEEDGGEEEVGKEVGREMVEDGASEYGEDQQVLVRSVVPE